MQKYLFAQKTLHWLESVLLLCKCISTDVLKSTWCCVDLGCRRLARPTVGTYRRKNIVYALLRTTVVRITPVFWKLLTSTQALYGDVTKHRTGAKYRSWVLVKWVWCGAYYYYYYWFQLRKGTGYGFHAFLTCILLLLLLIQCKISLYLGPVQRVQPVRCFVTPLLRTYVRVF